MRHHKKKTTKRRGGAWYDPRTWFEKKPEEAIAAAPVASEQAMGEVVEPLGATQENSGVPGGMPASAPINNVLTGGRRRRRKTRRRSKRGGEGETTTCKTDCPNSTDKKHVWGAWKNLGDVRQRQCSKCKCIQEV